MKKQYLYSIILVLFSLSSFSQNGNNTKMLEEAEGHVIEGRWEEASKLYEILLKEKPANSTLNFKLGHCLYNTKTGRYRSVDKFRSAIANYKENEDDISLITLYHYLGKAYHKNYEFDKAIETFEKVLSLSKQREITKSTQRELEISGTALKFFNNPKELIVTKLGVINSGFADHSPVISADESVLIFTSKRKGSTGDLRTPDGGFYEDVYIYNLKGGFRAKPKNIGPPINTPKHEATCGLSVDGQEMFIYRSVSETDGNIYYSKLEGDKWTIPEKLGSNINSKYRETHASLSADGNTLYFSSDRKGGIGGYDIYMSKKGEDGKWGKAINLGTNVNTPFNEEGPYIHPDGKSLYFSSEGHKGMGGFDVYTSLVLPDKTFAKAVNMGFPLNTVDNDVFYVPTADGKKAYYASQRSGVSDVYVARAFTQKEKVLTLVSGFATSNSIDSVFFDKSKCLISGDTIITPDRRVFISNRIFERGDSILISRSEIKNEKVLVIDSISKVPKNTVIYVLDASSNELENSYGPNSITGKYLFVLNEKKDYKIYFEAENHIFDTKDISLNTDSIFNEISYNASMDSIINGKIRKSKKIGFTTGLTSLTNFTLLELDILAYFLQKNPEIFVSFTGYDYVLDNSSRDYFPLEYEYAAKRKENVVNYLINKGVNENKVFVDMFPAHIVGDSLEYTIFDETAIEEAEEVKNERKTFFKETVNVVNKTETEVWTEYKKVVENDSTLQKDTVISVTMVEVEDILFDINAFITNKYEKKLNQLSWYLIANPNAVIQLEGYTDEQGPLGYNNNLSDKRANFIKNELIKKGVSKKQIITKAFGIKNPIAKNKNPNGEFIKAALHYNRRVEIKVIKQGKSSELKISRINVPDEFKIK